MYKLFASLGILGIICFFGFWCFAVFTSLYGLILAFKVSILLGVLVLFVEPAPFVIGLVMMFGHVNLALKIVQAIGLN